MEQRDGLGRQFRKKWSREIGCADSLTKDGADNLTIDGADGLCGYGLSLGLRPLFCPPELRLV
jgi:hypothetical protein